MTIKTNDISKAHFAIFCKCQSFKNKLVKLPFSKTTSLRPKFIVMINKKIVIHLTKRLSTLIITSSVAF